MPRLSRRRFLPLLAGVLAPPAIARAAPSYASARRRVRLVNAHTGEKYDNVYRDDSGPIVAAMAELAIFLRDFHTSTTIAIDVGVIDFLTAVMQATGAEVATILSAYRTPETNARLAQTTFGV